jgi:hypothetical protein
VGEWVSWAKVFFRAKRTGADAARATLEVEGEAVEGWRRSYSAPASRAGSIRVGARGSRRRQATHIDRNAGLSTVRPVSVRRPPTPGCLGDQLTAAALGAFAGPAP